MNKEYRKEVFKFMRSMGFHRRKSRPLARKLNRLSDDLASFKNPDNVGDLIRDSIKSAFSVGIVL